LSCKTCFQPASWMEWEPVQCPGLQWEPASGYIEMYAISPLKLMDSTLMMPIAKIKPWSMLADLSLVQYNRERAIFQVSIWSSASQCTLDPLSNKNHLIKSQKKRKKTYRLAFLSFGFSILRKSPLYTHQKSRRDKQ
jgi:hypothetical protein